MLAVACAAASAQPVDLTPSLDMQQPVLYEHVLRVDTTQGVVRIGEQSLRTQLFRRFKLSTHLLAGDQEDGAVAVALFQMVRVAMRVGRKDKIMFDFDSDRPRVSDPEQDAVKGQVTALRALAALDVTVRVDKNGKALSVDGLDSIEEFAKTDQGAAILLGFIGESWFRGMCDQVWGVGDAMTNVNVGDSWTQVDTAPASGGGTSSLEIAFNLVGVTDDEARIEGEGHVNIAEATPQIMPGAETEIINNKAAVSCRWSLSAKRTTQYTYRFSMETAVNAGGIDITQVQDVSQALQVVK